MKENSEIQTLPDQASYPQERQWLESLISAMNVLRLYPSDHPSAKHERDLLYQTTVALQKSHEKEISLTYAGSTVAVNHIRLDTKVLAFQRLAEELHQRNIHTLIFSEGIDPEELTQFMIVFSERPQNIILQGGMGILMEEKGIHRVRLATLTYASRSLQGQYPSEGDDERVLFARMEECLKDRESVQSQEKEVEISSSLVTFLENPKTTARFLERKKKPGSLDQGFIRQVASALDRAATIVYTHQPDRWDQAKKNIAEALLLLTPEIREKLLEMTSEEITHPVYLEEIVGSLEPEQIAVVLADYFSRIEQEDTQSHGSTPEDSIVSKNFQVPWEAGSLIEQLIRSPEHLQILQPLLVEEFHLRGMHLKDYESLFGPLCGEYFEKVKEEKELASIGSDKVFIYQFVQKVTPEEKEDIRDLLETINENEHEKSLRVIREEVLDIEDHPEIYEKVIGAQLIQSIKDSFRRGTLLSCRNQMEILIHHATHPEEDRFPGRPELARRLLKEIEPEQFLRIYWDTAKESTEVASDIRLLLQIDLVNLNQQLLDKALSLDIRESEKEPILQVFAERLPIFVPKLLEYLEESRAINHPNFWWILGKGLCEECWPLLESLMKDKHREIAERTIHLLGQLGTEKAEARLASIMETHQDLGKMAQVELLRMRSPYLIPFLEKQLFRFDYGGLVSESRVSIVRALGRLNHPESYRIIRRLLLQKRKVFFKNSYHRLLKEAMHCILQWPMQEAMEIFPELLHHPDPDISRIASVLHEQMKPAV